MFEKRKAQKAAAADQAAAAPRVARAPSPVAAPSPSPPTQPVQVIPPADHDAGWEYLYLASELARRLAVYQDFYGEYQSQVVVPSGQPIADPVATVHQLTDQAVAMVEAASQALSPETLEQAF